MIPEAGKAKGTPMKTPLLLSALAVMIAAGQASAATSIAQVKDRDGNGLGTVEVQDTPSGMVIIRLNLKGLPPGNHAIHLHETGDCSAPDFKSAGGHIAGDRQHGALNPDGPHPGDMPNLTVPDSGAVIADGFLPFLSVGEMLQDGDGAAFVMHDGTDDYQSQPAGDAGDRIACGVFEARQ